MKLNLIPLPEGTSLVNVMYFMLWIFDCKLQIRYRQKQNPFSVCLIEYTGMANMITMDIFYTKKLVLKSYCEDFSLAKMSLKDAA